MPHILLLHQEFQILIYRSVRTSSCLKVLVKLFQKFAGVGSAHKKGRFFLLTFSLRLWCQRKSGRGV